MDNSKTFTIHWRIWSTLQSCTVRSGYTCVATTGKREARKHLRQRLDGQVGRGEKIVVDNITASSF